MLQAATGKLFTEQLNAQVNMLRGEVYTNLDFGELDSLSCALGTLTADRSERTARAMCYEMKEHIEAGWADLFASYTIDTYIDDFADVVSFGLRALCTADERKSERLLSERCRPNEPHPRDRLTRFYDPLVKVSVDELTAFEGFTEQLIGLTRVNYLAAIEAIRTYVTAVHRMSEDLNLSYTLLVMSIESLAQKFDGYVTRWDDLDVKKRNGIDEALRGVGESEADAVRKAVLEHEHLQMGQRFAKFIMAHLPVDYFTEQSEAETYPIGRRDLEAALKNLYGVRSTYVHTLKPLSKEFMHFARHQETFEDGDKLVFSLQGLFRLVRAVIIEFISRADKIDHEPSEYMQSHPGTARVSVNTPWIYDPERLSSQTTQTFFVRLVELLSEAMENFPDNKFSSLRPVIERGFKIKDQMSAPSRLAFLAFVAIKQSCLNKEEREASFTTADLALLNKPSVVSLIAAVLAQVDVEWSESKHHELLNQYYAQRFKPTGIKLPTLVEASLGLSLVERYRQAGQIAEAEAALVSAKEDFPKLDTICRLRLDSATPVKWREIIYPKYTPKTVEADASVGQ